MINLYPHQADMVSAVRQAMTRSRTVLLQSATGSGKTAMAVYMIAGAQAKGKSVWFTVPRRELIKQTAETMNQFNIPYSFIAAGYSYNPYAKVHICSVDTLKTRLDKVTMPDLCIVDEAHYGSDGMDKIIKTQTGFVVGLSATPSKMSGEGLGKWYGDMVCGPSVRWLIDNKFLSEYRGYAPSSPDLSRIKKVAGDYAKGEVAEYMEADRVIVGDAVRHYRQHAMGKLNIAYCASIKASQMTAEKFRDAGVPAMHIDGMTPDIERRRIIMAYAKRELLCLCNAALLVFGFDLASQCGMPVTVESMSDIDPTLSLAKECQKWGRVLRPKDFPATIFDHVNNFRCHGLPCDEREWSLESREKGKGGDGERVIPIRQCSVCFAVHRPSPSCPTCGFVYPVQYREIKEKDGELQEVVLQARQKRMEVGKAKTLADLRRIAEERQYKPGWVSRMATLKGIYA